MKDEIEYSLIEYYKTFKQLVILHQKFNFGKAPRLSEGFTETLCAFIYGFEKTKNVKREYDLDDKKNNLRIEVKATSDDYGAVTLNPCSKFDYLYWINFRLETDSLHIQKIPYNLISNFCEKSKGQKRINITLSQIVLNNNADLYKILLSENKFAPQSVFEQLNEIKKINKPAA